MNFFCKPSPKQRIFFIERFNGIFIAVNDFKISHLELNFTSEKMDERAATSVICEQFAKVFSPASKCIYS